MELFIKPLEFEKTAYLRVSENPTEWTRDILEAFYNAFPYFVNYPVRIEYKQKDEQKGYAVGTIHIDHAEKVIVPLIIKNRELYPFDVAIIGGQTIPLTNYTIEAYIAKKSPFMQTIKRETGDITTMLFNSGGMGYMREMPSETYKTAALLDIVLPNTSEEERKAVLNEIADEHVAEGFKQNKTGSCVIKIASCDTKAPEIQKTAERVEALLDKDIWYIYKNGEFSYRGLFGNHLVSDTWEVDMTQDEVDAFKGRLIKTAVGSHKLPKIEMDAKDHAPVTLLKIDGEDGSLAILEDGSYVRIPSDVKHEIPLKNMHLQPKIGDPIKKYDEGAMKVGEAFVGPFKVDYVFQENGVTYVDGSSALRKYAFALHEDAVGGTNENGYVWTKPGSFIKLGKEQQLVDLLGSPAKNRISKTADGWSHNGQNPMDIHKTTWNLIQHGVSDDELEDISHMKEGDLYYIQSEAVDPKTNVEKIASEYDAECEKESCIIKTLARNFTKEASGIPDVPTVDKVLALNFVNKDTINTFIESTPLFEQAAFTMADLLTKARLGVQIVEEGALRKVMFGLLEIVEILKGIGGIKKKS